MATVAICKICNIGGKTKDAKHYCVECRAYLCGRCEAKHRAKASYKDHPVLPFTPIMNIEMTCFTHKEEAATVWCITCCGAICLRCDIGKHDKHKTCDLRVHLFECGSDMQSLVDDIEPVKEKIELNKTSILGQIDEMLALLAATEKEIQQHYSTIMEKITTKKDQLIAKLTETIQSRIQNLRNDLRVENNKIQQITQWIKSKNKALSGTKISDFETILDKGKNLVVLTSEDVQSGDMLHFIPEDSLEVGRLIDKLPVWETHTTEEEVSDVSFTSPTTLLVAHGYEGGASLYETQTDSVTFTYQRKILQDHHVVRIATHEHVLYFTCRHSNCNTVHRCDITTHRLTPDGQWPVQLFSKPTGIAVTCSGHVVVSDTDKIDVSVHKSNGDRLVTIGGQTQGRNVNTEIKFITPHHVASHSDKIYVSDAAQHTVFVLDVQGKLLYKIGSPGENDGEFDTPRSICFTASGSMLIADKKNNRVSQFDNDGSFISHVITSQTADIGQPWFISLLNRGNSRFICMLCNIDGEPFVKIFNIVL